MNPFIDNTKQEAMREAVKARALQELRASIRPGEKLTEWALQNRAGVALLDAADALNPRMGKVEHQKLLREILKAMVGGNNTGML